MKRISSEKELLKKLDVSSMENIPQKINQFIDLLPNIDKELAEKIINQLPEYRKICTDILKTLESSCKHALESSDKSLKSTIDSYTIILNSLSRRLNNDNISDQERKEITKDMVDIADKISNLHQKNQNFILKILAVILFPITIILLIIAALLGGKKKE